MLAIKEISKSFQQNGQKLQAIENISLDIKKGEFVAVVGPSGCGKTSLLKIVAGLLKPSQGIIEHQHREDLKVGYVFQKPNLLEWRTVEENVKLPLEIQGKGKREVKKVLRLVGMTKFKSYLPNQLSGGMQQRVAIARALSFNPHVLLMDEPFSAIDDFGRDELNLVLTEIWQKTKKTILFVTHNIEEAVFLADRIVVLAERPTHVKSVLPVSLERPRSLDIKHTQQFQGHVKWVKSTLAG